MYSWSLNDCALFFVLYNCLFFFSLSLFASLVDRVSCRRGISFDFYFLHTSKKTEARRLPETKVETCSQNKHHFTILRSVLFCSVRFVCRGSRWVWYGMVWRRFQPWLFTKNRIYIPQRPRSHTIYGGSTSTYHINNMPWWFLENAAFARASIHTPMKGKPSKSQ